MQWQKIKKQIHHLYNAQLKKINQSINQSINNYVMNESMTDNQINTN